MRRRRSSSRWSRKLMAVRPSRDSSAGGSSAAISGIGSLGQRDGRSPGPESNRRQAGPGSPERWHSEPTGRLAPDGRDGLAGLFSRSSCEISDSICALNSFEARLNSFRALPICRPISGNFLGPNRIRAKRKRKIISGKPRFIASMILPERIAGNRCVQLLQASSATNGLRWNGVSAEPPKLESGIATR